ncbi:TerD family protein [Brevibacillus porteri]|uniref:Chemical-damaging agent resistance protein C n=1 Tax=Brevibacillus porteri TaxID=2126350 RepID=A0ABX5FWY4_9BACL|nr:TerD family protein [Brevibacillus porteri]MED1801025.1 TerD family protein [Brevibacillus porteri]MED2130411.1 TerD family protein [Brevibacillus porteri]MED2745160.1 TerD family protein [Brevibacillus porteri]MED2812651.1 TerD family protein [Brevibacillus porteri]MED2895375.1 TerD family protein [Brevibacillus porteri]
MLVISLTKGQKIDLTKGNPNLTKIVVGLGWDTNKYSGGQAFDLDAAAFLLRTGGRASGIQDFVFYNNLQGGNGSVVHTGDNLTGEGDGDDEQIKVDLKAVPADIEKVAITITIHEADIRNQNFGQVSNAFVRIVDETTGREVLRYDLGEDFSVETAIVVCELYRHQGEWKFAAVGSGFSGGLRALANNFGLQVS